MNIYFQDEARFGLMTHLGSMITAKGVAPVVDYKHEFKNTYLYGSYSPINGDSFVYEIEQVNCEIFEKYLYQFSRYKPDEYKIVVIDNAGFHSTKNISVPDNIYLLRIPPYTPELNPCEQIWKYIKDRFKNNVFKNLKELKEWLHNFVKDMDSKTIKSIVSNEHYKNAFYAN